MGDRFAALIGGSGPAEFARGENHREKITDLVAGGAQVAGLEAEIERYMAHQGGRAPRAA